MTGTELTQAEICVEVASAAFVDSHGPNYRPGIFGPVSPTGELQTPFRPTALVNCLEFLIQAAGGDADITEPTQMAVDSYLDLLIAARGSRNG